MYIYTYHICIYEYVCVYIYIYIYIYTYIYIYIFNGVSNLTLVSVWSVKNFDESAFYGNRTRFFSKTDRFQKAAIFSS